MSNSASASTGHGKGTYGVVIVAADRLGGALVAGADADDGDGRAVEADLRVDGAEHDAEQSEDDRHQGVSRLQDRRARQLGSASVTKKDMEERGVAHRLNLLAALDRAGGAGVLARLEGAGGGGRSQRVGDGGREDGQG